MDLDSIRQEMKEMWAKFNNGEQDLSGYTPPFLVAGKETCKVAHVAEMVPSKAIKAEVLDAKTIVVSCGILEMDHSTYGYQANEAVDQLRGKPWSPSMLEEHRSIFEQA